MSERNSGDPRPERPRHEPEIIPPAEPGARRPSHVWISLDGNDGTGRIYVARPSPFTVILVLAILGLVAIAILVVLLSVALLWIPLVMVLVAGFILSLYLQRFRSWLARR